MKINKLPESVERLKPVIRDGGKSVKNNLSTSEDKLKALAVIAEKLCDAVENIDKLSPAILGPSAIKAANEARSTLSCIKEETAKWL